MMYRCVNIHENERCFQKILWRYSCQEPIKVYSLNTVTYGTSSAPFQATRCLVELANNSELQYPRTSKIIRHSFYMDDLLVSVNSDKEALLIYHEITSILEKANFHLRKWSSNSRDILNTILTLNDNQNRDNLILCHNDKELKTLGIAWDPDQDVLKYSISVKFNNEKCTKRTILSSISQIFDPLGLVGPAMIQAKLLIQSLWKLELGWGEEIPDHL